MKFSHSFVVKAVDIDELGHVNNVAYLRWIQDVAVAHWQNAATCEMQDKYYWVVVRHEIDYKLAGFENEELTAKTWIGEWSRVTCDRFTEIYRGKDLLVKGRTVWCMFDRKSSRPSRISTEIIGKFS